MQKASLRAILTEKELWILILLGILYFYRPLFLGETFFYRDLCLHYLPRKQLFIDLINIGEWPLWDPYLHGGQPFLANISNLVLYPSNFLYLLFPLLRAFTLDIVLHVIFCAVGAYLLARTLGLQPVSSFITGIFYGFCGYTLSLINVLIRLLAISHLPFLLLFWHLYLLERRKRWFAITAMVGTVQVIVGAPEITLMSLLFLLGWAFFYPYPYKSTPQLIILWLFLVIFIAGLSSIQIFPTIEVVLQSSRGQGLDYASFSTWSLHPKRLPEIFFPGFLGRTDRLQNYWGEKIEENQFPYILSIYSGCLAIALTFMGGLHNKSNEDILSLRVRRFLLLLLILAILLSLGRFLPGFYLFYQYVPLVQAIRYPIKFLAAGILPIALLIGYTSEVHFGGRKPAWTPTWKILMGLWLIFTLLLAFTLTFLLSNSFASHFQEFFFGQSGENSAWQSLALSFIHTSTIWLLVTLTYQYRQLKVRDWQHSILAGILIVDLFLSGKAVNPYAPEEFFTDVPDAVQIIHKEIGEGRLFRTIDPANLILKFPSDDFFWKYRWSLEALNFYLAVFYRIPVIFHDDYDGLAQRQLMSLKALIYLLPWEQKLPLLSAGGVTLILTTENLSIPGLQHIATIPTRSDVPLFLYRNQTSMKRVEFVTGWEVVNSDPEALKAMMKLSYDPRKQVVLQGSGSALTPYPSTVGPVSKECNNSQLKKIESGNRASKFLVFNDCDGYLVFSEPFYPGWQVYVDGKPEPVLHANAAFSAVFLRAGSHEVERFYFPISLMLGALNSFISCVLLLVIIRMQWFLKLTNLTLI